MPSWIGCFFSSDRRVCATAATTRAAPTMIARITSIVTGFSFPLFPCADPQVCVVGIGKSYADAIAAHNPPRARHYGSEKIPELEIGNHVISQFKEKSNALVLLQQLLL